MESLKKIAQTKEKRACSLVGIMNSHIWFKGETIFNIMV